MRRLMMRSSLKTSLNPSSLPGFVLLTDQVQLSPACVAWPDAVTSKFPPDNFLKIEP